MANKNGLCHALNLLYPHPMLEDILCQIFPLHINHSLVLGALLLTGVLGGLFADRIKWLPTISGLMLVGLIMGPEGIGLIDHTMMAQALTSFRWP